MSIWNDYLQSLCNDYAQWWKAYTLTDVVGQQRVEQKKSPLLLNFMVEMESLAKEERSEAQEKTERLDVLAGLRKYAQEHVLMVGRPGSGKSTALVRLLLEEAEKARSPLNPPLESREAKSSESLLLSRADKISGESFSQDKAKSSEPPFLRGAGGIIPVLVELRYYQTSVLDLIRDFLKRHRLLLDTATIEQLLLEGQFLLLVDGINELPSEKARQDLYKFRQDYQKTTPMIFTTRDLGVGGDLGITKKLEMQPLTAEQMQKFVCAYLPEQGEQMLQNLGDRLREFGETPLLLWMLCSLFQATGDIPPNLGLVFRQFTHSYNDKLKPDIPVTSESRRWWTRLLEHLAFYMTKGEKLTGLNVAIPRLKAEEVLTQFLQAEKFDRPLDRALEWLQDLLNHHLIQLGANNQIEFRHQLIQDYYTAECLLKQLPNLSDKRLQREYLNYLKWTEPLKLMLELVDDGAQAVQVVNLALEVDWQLGAKLAGAVKPEFQQQTVDLVAGLEISLLFKIYLLYLTKSNKAIPGLIKLLEDEDSDVRSIAASALREIKSEAGIPGLIKLLEDEDSDVRSIAASALGEIKSEAGIPGLIKLLEHEDSSVRYRAAFALGEIKSEAGIPGLIKLLEDEDFDVRYLAASALGKIKSEAAIPGLIKLLEHEDSSMRYRAAFALEEIKSEAAIFGLIKLLEHEAFSVRYRAASALGKIKSEAAIPGLIKLLEHEESSVRYRAAEALEEIKSEAAIPGLINLLEDEDSFVRSRAASALGKIKSESAIPGLIKLLEDEDFDVRYRAASALEEIKSEAAIPGLIKLLEDEDFSVRYRAASALGKIKSEAAIPGLINLLEHEDSSVRYRAAEALEEIKSEAAIPGLIKLLEDEDSDVRSIAAYALGEIKSEAAIPGLIKFLEYEHFSVRSIAASALGKIKSEAEISGVIKSFEYEHFSVRSIAASALGKIKSEAAISGLIKLLEHEDSSVRSRAAEALEEIKSEAAIHGLINLLEDEHFDVRYRAAEALEEIKSEAAIPGLINLLEDEHFDVRSRAASALGKIKSEAAIPGLIKLLENEDFDVRYRAAEALGEIKSEAAIPGLINLLEYEHSDVRYLAASALGEIKSEAAIPGLIKLLEHENNIDNVRDALQALEAIQENCKYYNSLTQPITKPNPQLIKTSLMQILHLSDLHFGTDDQATLWSNQLATDLRNELEIPHLDALILSGDIANKSTPAEYEAAQQFFDELRQDFALQPEQIIIVPGNHDLNWELAENAYQLIDRKKYKGELKEGEYIEESSSVIRVRDEEKYQQRFEHFSNFYQIIKNKSYPSDYYQQYTLDHFPNHNLLILGLNSAWQLDHHYKSRASINMNTLSNALTKIRRQKEYENCIKIAVWHHPLDSAWDDRIKDQSFMEQLAVAGFRFFLHGHVHQAQQGFNEYDAERGLFRICAGTFGAPTHELTTAEPWQYHLMKLENNTLTVRSRKRKTENGAWEPDNCWRQGKGKASLDSYTITWE
ncbi:MAG TPA: HEAT repeat domain-containing protein [Nodularia sp. (in: cyanobacteria)]|nr:HEAT repeat domain-containing protein [Nodularia sp. (in: cyanobacteria)]